MTLLPKCESYIPKSILKEYPDYLPQSSKDGRYIGLLTPELIREYIRNLHQYHITILQNAYNICQTDTEFAADYAKRHLANELTSWKTSLESFDKKHIPYYTETSYAYFLYII